MPDLSTDLREQPAALRELLAFYETQAGSALLDRPQAPRLCVFTGMGASYHAALIAAAHASAVGIPALAVEAIDLLNYQSPGLLRPGHTLIYISQSGKSVEIGRLLELNAGRAEVVAVTNQPGSLLAQNAVTVLPIFAEQRYRLASKNYVNTLAALWLLVRRWSGQASAGDYEALRAAAGCMETLRARAEQTSAALLAGFQEAQPLVFLGHGPHAATARQAALMLSEWARAAAHYSGVGAFRHGFVETVTPGMGALLIAPPGRTLDSALSLARALVGFGVRVQRVSFGRLLDLEDDAGASAAAPGLDEFLSPLLDVVPMQFFADALAHARGVEADFKYIEGTRSI